jgi:hypothetical protein
LTGIALLCPFSFHGGGATVIQTRLSLRRREMSVASPLAERREPLGVAPHATMLQREPRSSQRAEYPSVGMARGHPSPDGNRSFPAIFCKGLGQRETLSEGHIASSEGYIASGGAVRRDQSVPRIGAGSLTLNPRRTCLSSGHRARSLWIALEENDASCSCRKRGRRRSQARLLHLPR